MPTELLIVSTCGTSLLTNGATDEDRRWLTSITNRRNLDGDDARRLAALVSARRQTLAGADEPTRRRMTAEINGIDAVLSKNYAPGPVFHVLVYTDTAVGEATAEIVGDALGGATKVTAPGLRTSDLGSFRAAVVDLKRTLDDTVEGYRDQGAFVVFNLTGGFKSLNGFLQTVGMLSADRCVFLFEGSAELMEIPRLPIHANESQALTAHLDVFRRLAMNYEVSAEQAAGIPEVLLFQVSDSVLMSELGETAWRVHREALFADELCEPLSARVRVSEPVKRVFRSLETARKADVNRALDDFCAHHDKKKQLPAARPFKALAGNPVPGSTHELYAWRDGAAWRFFGHYEGEVFVFDRLGAHL
ncbi:MAG: hypothetical protein IT374_00775 [Polyangiaceae bacterium]|nr:hypothetical protein [Polyangiaceae bacterium]